MSVIVKGIYMPKYCSDCPFMISREDDAIWHCGATNTYKFIPENERTTSRPDWCPLEEVKNK